MTSSGRVIVTDSITRLGDDPAGAVAIAASHGGAYCAHVALRAQLRGVILHDAGLGKDAAGIGALAALAGEGIPAATVDGASARIGDGADVAQRGRISHVNAAAAALGCAVGEPARACAERMQAAPLPAVSPSHASEARTLAEPAGAAGAAVWLCDSNALVRAADLGSVVVTGSHGAALATAPRWAGPWVRGALFNDAGGASADTEPDGAGTSRLPMLDDFDIAAATVDAFSARIGEAHSTYEDGVISHINATAQAAGVRVGMAAKEAVALLRRRPQPDHTEPDSAQPHSARPEDAPPRDTPADSGEQT